jgi:hypothetical protein
VTESGTTHVQMATVSLRSLVQQFPFGSNGIATQQSGRGESLAAEWEQTTPAIVASEAISSLLLTMMTGRRLGALPC